MDEESELLKSGDDELIKCYMKQINAWKLVAQSIQYCVTFTPYVTLLFLQILAYTHVANEIIIQSTAIATAAYDSEWYHFNDEYKKRLLFLIIRAQKPLSMNIGSFGPMTKETALFMIRAVYSYIAFFNNSD
ncbi:odorant receptor 30a-like [Sitophilus oryzae]|uniref:Odorant receptor 30a-like n=1 Tax=Sitophilus oryzae TaxID=7048 RepID=A0A6J2YLF6_SITOR|nr:odorant receptor 30a-like [Sitophilus oryzae]